MNSLIVYSENIVFSIVMNMNISSSVTIVLCIYSRFV